MAVLGRSHDRISFYLTDGTRQWSIIRAINRVGPSTRSPRPLLHVLHSGFAPLGAHTRRTVPGVRGGVYGILRDRACGANGDDSKDSHQRSNASTHDSVHSHDMDAEDMGHHDADSGTAHKCGTCGACHAVALMPNTSIVRTQYLPAADLAEPRFLPVAFFPPSSNARLGPEVPVRLRPRGLRLCASHCR